MTVRNPTNQRKVYFISPYSYFQSLKRGSGSTTNTTSRKNASKEKICVALDSEGTQVQNKL